MKKIISLLIIGSLLTAGICTVLYPTVSNIINNINNESTIIGYNKNVDSCSSEKIEKMFSDAQSYNQALAENYISGDSGKSLEILKEYNKILDFGEGLIGYIEIPDINVNLPVFHGESEEVLQKGAAHLQNTSFPVGGINTHTVISAHSGYPTQKFFDDIDELKKDSLIYVHTLNLTLTYKVCSSEISEPDDSSKLNIAESKDLITLVTCYPYGINSHRLLVTGERINNVNTSTSDETAESKKQIHSFPYIGLICIALVIIFFIIYKIKNKLNKR